MLAFWNTAKNAMILSIQVDVITRQLGICREKKNFEDVVNAIELLKRQLAVIIWLVSAAISSAIFVGISTNLVMFVKCHKITVIWKNIDGLLRTQMSTANISSQFLRSYNLSKIGVLYSKVSIFC
jgi:hypothetical protein